MLHRDSTKYQTIITSRYKSYAWNQIWVWKAVPDNTREFKEVSKYVGEITHSEDNDGLQNCEVKVVQLISTYHKVVRSTAIMLPGLVPDFTVVCMAKENLPVNLLWS